MAHQTNAARAWAKLADIENGDIKVRDAGKRVPRESCQKTVQARMVDGRFLMKKDIEFQEKGQKAEENAKVKTAKARTKVQTGSVVGKGRGKASVVAIESSKSPKQKGKEHPMLSSYCAFSRSLTICTEVHCGKSDSRGRGWNI